MRALWIARAAVAGVLVAGAAACTSTTANSAPPPSSAPAQHPAETLTPLLQQALPNVADKTFTSSIVTFPPNARATPHRHGQAFVYAYVLEGSIRSQVDDKPVGTFHQGQNWVEQPGAHHVLTENSSATEPAKLLVVFVSTTGEPLKVDDSHP